MNNTEIKNRIKELKNVLLSDDCDERAEQRIFSEIKSLRSLLKTHTGQIEDTNNQIVETTKRNNIAQIRSGNSNLTNRKTEVRAKQNKWRDNGEARDPNFNPEDFERIGRTPRTRQAPKKMELECHVCGKTFSVDKNLVYGEYVRCNRCTGR